MAIGSWQECRRGRQLRCTLTTSHAWMGGQGGADEARRGKETQAERLDCFRNGTPPAPHITCSADGAAATADTAVLYCYGNVIFPSKIFEAQVTGGGCDKARERPVGSSRKQLAAAWHGRISERRQRRTATATAAGGPRLRVTMVAAEGERFA
jgi:hypothetical protein